MPDWPLGATSRLICGSTSKLPNFQFCGADHFVTEFGKQLLLIGVAMNCQERRPVAVKIEHSRLLLRGENNQPGRLRTSIYDGLTWCCSNTERVISEHICIAHLRKKVQKPICRTTFANS